MMSSWRLLLKLNSSVVEVEIETGIHRDMRSKAEDDFDVEAMVDVTSEYCSISFGSTDRCSLID